MTRADRTRIDWPFIALLILAGIALRILLFSASHGSVLSFIGAGEAARAAISLATNGVFGDAFFTGHGPTAHLTPISPAIAAGVMMLLGVDSPAANLTLMVWSLVQVIAGWLLLIALFRRLGADATALHWALAALSLMPVFAADEIIVFRFWEGALALDLVILNLILLIDAERAASVGNARLAGIGILCAATFFLSPPAGMAVVLCWAIWAMRRLAWSRIIGFGAVSAAALALMVAPWAIRNAAVLGEPVLLRSNAGLELAIGNHPGALSDRPNGEVYFDRLRAVQPYFGKDGQRALQQAGGEVAYARALGAEARGWIAANPADFARLFLRHLRQFFFPEPWQLMFSMAGPRAAFMGLVSAIGLAGLAIALWQRRSGYWMIAVYLAAVAMPYAVVQPVQRYSYLVYGILVMLAADALVRLVRHARLRRVAAT